MRIIFHSINFRALIRTEFYGDFISYPTHF